MRGQKAMGMPLGLLTLAAILPQNWTFRLVDQNAAKLRDRDFRWADLVCVGGMAVQQMGILDVIRRAREHGKFVAAGGADPTSQPTVYRGADALVLGEAETTVPVWFKAWEDGSPAGTFRQPCAPDVAESPIPRFDLVRPYDYLTAGIQYSRGCPFNCEFCAITELYGRRPRTKTPEQVCRELNTLYEGGYRGWVDVVDDNFIGNKRDVKRMLPVLIEWCQERHYPFYFSTETSLNLADDPELMDLMVAADFRYIFTGIETADEQVLQSAQKPMNARRPLDERIRTIYEHGLAIGAGFVLGFDGESEDCADAMFACVQENALPVAMVSLLVALPLTQLTRRLASEGRLRDMAGNRVATDELYEMRVDEISDTILDQALTGLNFETDRDRGQILNDQMRLIDALYDPANYMARASEALRRIRPAWKHAPSRVERWGDIRWFWSMLFKMICRPDIRKHVWPLLRQGKEMGVVEFGLAAGWATIYLHFMELRTQLLKSLEQRRHTEVESEAAEQTVTA
jgi:radical SAM superfamily enzyme YgiQ (UPF0313 family)